MNIFRVMPFFNNNKNIDEVKKIIKDLKRLLEEYSIDLCRDATFPAFLDYLLVSDFS